MWEGNKFHEFGWHRSVVVKSIERTNEIEKKRYVWKICGRKMFGVKSEKSSEHRVHWLNDDEMKHKLSVVSNDVYKSDANRLSESSVKVVSDALHWPQSSISIENETQTYALFLVLILNVCHSINLRGAVKIKYTPPELIITPHTDLRHIRLGYSTFLLHITHIPLTHMNIHIPWFFFIIQSESLSIVKRCHIVSFLRFVYNIRFIHIQNGWRKKNAFRLNLDRDCLSHCSFFLPLLFR